MLGLGFVTEPHRLGQGQQVVPLADVLRQLVLELLRQRQGGADQGGDLLGGEAFDQVVLRHEPADVFRPGVFPAVEFLVVGIAHLETAVTRCLDGPGQRHSIAAVQLARDPWLIEPDDVQLIVGAVHEDGLGEPESLVFADLWRDLADGASDGGERPVGQVRDRLWLAELLPAKGEVEKEVADRLDAERPQALEVERPDLGQR